MDNVTLLFCLGHIYQQLLSRQLGKLLLEGTNVDEPKCLWKTTKRNTTTYVVGIRKK